VSDPVCQRIGLAGTRSRDDEQRPRSGAYCFFLPGVELLWSWGHDGHYRPIGKIPTEIPYSSRSAVGIGSRAARIAGKSPPINPIASAYASPMASSCGVTRKAKATWLKV
jgi:hypothetical protein